MIVLLPTKSNGPSLGQFDGGGAGAARETGIKGMLFKIKHKFFAKAGVKISVIPVAETTDNGQ